MPLSLPLLPRWIRYLGVGVVLGLLGYFSLAGTVSAPSGAGSLWDKRLHLIAYAGLTLSLGYATVEYRRHRMLRVLGVIGFALVVGAGIEFAQSYIATRQASSLDMIANAIGVLLASLWFLIEPHIRYLDVEEL